MIVQLLTVQLPPFGETVRAALRLDGEIYAAVQTSRQGLEVALLVMALAALSEAIGQSVVLFLNRVRPGRFVLALTIAAGSNVVGYVLWTTCIWLAGSAVAREWQPFVAVAAAVGLSYAPQLFAFFELTPYFGNFFGLILTLWSAAAVVVAIRAGMGLPMGQAALIGLLSWMLIQLWRRSLGRPVYALGRFVERSAAGSRLELSMDDALNLRLRRQQLGQNWKLWLQKRSFYFRAQAERAQAQAEKAFKPVKGEPPDA
jgi:hypothetical protein